MMCGRVRKLKAETFSVRGVKTVTHSCFTVFDAAAEAYLPPFFAQNHGVARRLFESACADEEHQFFKYAEDYTLFYIGEFDDASGELLPNQAPVRVASALELVKKGPRLAAAEVSNG